jgi:hypothetical protein
VAALHVALAAAPALGAPPVAELVLSTGGFNIGTERPTLEGGLELRLRPRLLLHTRRGPLEVIPLVGALYTSGNAAYGYLGGRVELWLAPRWLVTPSFAGGAYRGGEDKDLGHGVEFRSALELAYLLGDGGRLGLAVYHLSNGGLARRNPGSESLVLTYSFWPRWRLP